MFTMQDPYCPTVKTKTVQKIIYQMYAGFMSTIQIYTNKVYSSDGRVPCYLMYEMTSLLRRQHLLDFFNNRLYVHHQLRSHLLHAETIYHTKVT